MKTGDYIDKPWGWEKILDLNDHYCIKHLFINGGHRLSKQYHESKTETLILVDGQAELTLGSSDCEHLFAMESSHPYAITPGMIHRLRATADQGALILEVSTTELHDGVRIEDDDGRTGT